MKGSIYSNYRTVCERLIEDNLKTSDLLKIDGEWCDYFKNMRKENDFKLYKYFSPSILSIDSFENDLLNCSSPREYNDIYEGMVRPVAGYSHLPTEKINEIIEKACEMTSVTCFTESWDNLLMYAHYAQSFEGFCLGYDMRLIREHIDGNLFLFPVLYNNRPVNLDKMEKMSKTIDGIRNKIPTVSPSEAYTTLRDLTEAEDLISYFIHKSNHWSYEEEWRFIIPVSQYERFFNGQRIDKKHHQIRNFDCVTEVYLGARASENLKTEIGKIVHEKNRKRAPDKRIIIYNTNIKNDSYELERHPV